MKPDYHLCLAGIGRRDGAQKSTHFVNAREIIPDGQSAGFGRRCGFGCPSNPRGGPAVGWRWTCISSETKSCHKDAGQVATLRFQTNFCLNALIHQHSLLRVWRTPQIRSGGEEKNKSAIS